MIFLPLVTFQGNREIELLPGERRRPISKVFRALALSGQLIEFVSGLAAIFTGLSILFWWKMEPPFIPFLRLAPEVAWAVLFLGGGSLALDGHIRRDRRLRRIACFGGALTWAWVAIMYAVCHAPVATAVLGSLSLGLALDYITLREGTNWQTTKG